MTIDEAIRALTQARDEVGGDAPLVMPDGLHVVGLQPAEEDGCVYVSDSPQPRDDEGDDSGAESGEAPARWAPADYVGPHAQLRRGRPGE